MELITVLIILKTSIQTEELVYDASFSNLLCPCNDL